MTYKIMGPGGVVEYNSGKKSESFKYSPSNQFLPKGYDPHREFMFKEKDIDQALRCHAILTRKINPITEKDVYGQTHSNPWANLPKLSIS